MYYEVLPNLRNSSWGASLGHFPEEVNLVELRLRKEPICSNCSVEPYKITIFDHF